MVNKNRIKNPGYLFLYTGNPGLNSELSNLPSLFNLKTDEKVKNKSLKIFTGRILNDNLIFEGFINKFDGINNNTHTLRSYSLFDNNKIISYIYYD